MHDYAEVSTDYMNGYAVDTIVSKLVGGQPSPTELVRYSYYSIPQLHKNRLARLDCYLTNSSIQNKCMFVLSQCIVDQDRDLIPISAGQPGPDCRVGNVLARKISGNGLKHSP